MYNLNNMTVKKLLTFQPTIRLHLSGKADVFKCASALYVKGMYLW